MLLAVAIAVVGAATAHAADYSMVLCAANNGSNGYQTATNTTSPQNPGGIFDFKNYCGPAPDPAGDNAFLRIDENQSSGNAGNSAYGSISWTGRPGSRSSPPAATPASPTPSTKAGAAASGPEASTARHQQHPHAGRRAAQLRRIGGRPPRPSPPTSGPSAATATIRRFVFELTCVRPAGCDRSGFNAVDANTLRLHPRRHLARPRSASPTPTAPLARRPVGARHPGPRPTARPIRARASAWSGCDIDGAAASPIDHAANATPTPRQSSGEFARDFQPCATAGQHRPLLRLRHRLASPTAPTPCRPAPRTTPSARGSTGPAGESCQQTTDPHRQHRPRRSRRAWK